MSQSQETQHFRIIREIAGDAIAREDMPAVERAYQDFRVGMDELRKTFEILRATGDEEDKR